MVDDVLTGGDRDFTTVSTTRDDVYEWCPRFPATTTTTKTTPSTEESAGSILFTDGNKDSTDKLQFLLSTIV